MKPWGRALLVGLSALVYAGLAYGLPRSAFGPLLGLLGLAFGLYGLLLRAGLSVRQGLGAALLLRLLWLPALPTLSDDYHRFRWDGLLVTNGLNPFQFRPEQLLGPAGAAGAPSLPPAVNRQLRALYPRLNSPRYYSVYPPVCQAVFGAAAGLFPASERGFVLVVRLVILLAEAGTALLLLGLLRHWHWPPERALWYLLNPLVVIELTGNLHPEGLAICFLLLTIWLLARGRPAAAGGTLALAVATKLLPLLMLPLLARRLSGRAWVGLGAGLGVGLVALFYPLVSAELVGNVGRSLNLYFRHFEFNASVYYLLRAAGQWYLGYNPIARLGPALALATAAGGLLLAATERRPSWPTLPRALLGLFTLYFGLATVVHPWYLTPLVALSTFTRLRYGYWWSGVVGLSYAAYRTSIYSENLGLVALEYAVVLIAWGLDYTRSSALPALPPG